MRTTIAFCLWLTSLPLTGVAAEIPVAELVHPDPVDFERELLPVLRKKCLACHNETDAESDFVGESPQTIANGGSSGPAVEPGKPDESLLMQLAAHRTEPVMPPEDNDSGAVPMTSAELALLKLWIEQGAQGEVRATAEALHWKPLPEQLMPVYAAAQSQDGRRVAVGRANQIWVHDLAFANQTQRLTDPALEASPSAIPGGVAHQDFVQSLAFSHDGNLLASGGYRTLKLWQRIDPEIKTVQLASQPIKRVAALGTRWLLLTSDNELRLVTDPAHKASVFEPRYVAIAADQDRQQFVALTDALQLNLLSKDGIILSERNLSASESAPRSHSVSCVALGPTHAVVSSPTTPLTAWGVDSDGSISEQSFAFNCNGAPIVAIAFLTPVRFATASKGGEICIWKVGEFEPEKRLQHGADVINLAATANRMVSVGTSMAKLWDVETGTTRSDLAKNPELEWLATQARLAEEVAKRHVDNQKQDLDAARKRVEAEESNLQKTIEAKQKADEAQTAAAEPSAQATAALDELDKNLAAARKRLALAAKTLEQTQSAQDQDEVSVAETARAQAEAEVQRLESERKPKQEVVDKATKTLADAKQAVESAAQSVATAENAVTAAKLQVSDLEPRLQLAEQQQNAATAHREASDAKRSSFQHHAHLVAFSRDGQRVVTVDLKGAAVVSDAISGKALALVPMQPDTANDELDLLSMEFTSNADGIELTLVSSDGSLRARPLVDPWRLTRAIGSTDGDSPFSDRVTAISFCPDDTRVAIGGGQPSRDGELYLINVSSGEIERQIQNAHSDTIFGLAFSPDGDRLASCGADRFMKVFDANSGELQRNFEGHTHHVLAVAWRADGRVLATGGADKLVKLWNAEDGSQLTTIKDFGKEITAVNFGGTTDDLFATSGDTNLYRCNVKGERKSIGTSSDFLYALSVNADGNQVIFAGYDSIVRIVDRDGTVITQLP